MPRFQGTLVEDQPKKPRFAGLPVEASPEAEQPSTLEAVGRGVFQGGTAFLADEMVAGAKAGPINLGTITKMIMEFKEANGRVPSPQEIQGFSSQAKQNYDERYTKELDQYRAGDDAAREAHPVAFGGGELAGGVGTALVPMGAMIKSAQGATALTKAAIGSGTGAVGGFAGGFADGRDGFQNRINNAFLPAAMGAGLGVVAPTVGRWAQKAMNAIKGRKLNTGIDRASQKILLRELEDSPTSPAEMLARTQSLGDEAMVMDAMPNFQRQGEMIANSPSSGKAKIVDALMKRDQAASGRINTAIDDTFGPRFNVPDRIDEINAARNAKLKPLYDEAYSDIIPQTDDIASLLQTPSGSKALKEAQNLAKDKGFNLDPENITVQGGDMIKRSFDDMIYSARDTPNKASAMRGLNDEMKDILDTASPAFAEARRVGKQQFDVRDAFEQGREVFNKKNHPDFLARDIEKMDPEAIELLRQGARSSIDDVRGYVQNPDLKARTFFDAPYKKENLGLVVGHDKAGRFVSQMDAEKTFKDTLNQTIGNSATARRLENPYRPSADTKGITKTADQLIGSILKKIAGSTDESARNHVSEAMAEILTRKGAKRDEVLQALIGKDAIRQRGGATDRRTQTVVRALMQRLAVPLTSSRNR